jgi:hypothetical protein
VGKSKVITQHSNPLTSQPTQRKLAVLSSKLGILRIESKKRKRPPARGPFPFSGRIFLCALCVLCGKSSWGMFFQMKFVPATTTESNRSAPPMLSSMLSSLSTQARSNDFKSMRKATHPKKTQCPNPMPQKKCKSPSNPQAQGKLPSSTYPPDEDILCALSVLPGGVW